MKLTTKILFSIMLLSNVLVSAQNEQRGTVKLRGTKLTYPLIEKWIEEFKKEYPAIRVSIAPTAPADSIDFKIASYRLGTMDLSESEESIIVSQYIQLPVANVKRPDLEKLQEQGITQSDLMALFFTSNIPNLYTSSASGAPINLYVRDKPVCAVKAFASHFGADPDQIKGIGIKGDDQDLANAVRNDVNGLSFNNLGFIYDVKTRLITPGLAVVPLDLNENGKIDRDERIYATLDDVIAFIEKTHHPKFVNEPVNFILKKHSINASAGIFLNWVLTTGQSFQHDLGFVTIDEQALSKARAATAASFKLSAPACESADNLMSKRKQKHLTK